MYYDGKCITWQYYMVHLLIQKNLYTGTLSTGQSRGRPVNR